MPELALLFTCLAAFLACLVTYPAYIKRLESLRIQQVQREDGLESHKNKSNKITMGGILFALVTTAVSFAALNLTGLKANWSQYLILIVALGCCAIGFADDYAKVTSKTNKGVSGNLRLGLEFVLGGILGLTILLMQRQVLILPFDLSSFHFELSQLAPPIYIFLPLSIFMVAACANAANIHDGMDGLAAGTACQIFATLSVMLWYRGFYIEALIAAAAAGALIGFLIFNRYPAQLFMGDTGSLFIGGLMGALVVSGGLTLWFIPLSVIYIVEVLSVFLQFIYFRLTKPYHNENNYSPLKVLYIKLTKTREGQGKRLFKMAPIHHHFEMVGSQSKLKLAEWQVVSAFWLVQFILCVIVLSIFFAAASIK